MKIKIKNALFAALSHLPYSKARFLEVQTEVGLPPREA